MALSKMAYTHQGDFLAEMKNNILLAIFDQTKDTSTAGKSTRNSVIQEYKSTRDYYDKMEGPIYEPITVENAIIRQSLPPEVETLLQQKWKNLNENGQHQCPFVKDEKRCPQTFSNKSRSTDLIRHYQKLHTETPEFQCKICIRNFTVKLHAEDHVKIDHMFLKPYECQECDLPFSSARHLKRHEETVHLVPPTNSILYTENKSNKKLSSSVFLGDKSQGGVLKTQVYMIIWFDKVTKKVMGISFEYTSLKDVKLSAENLRKDNILAAERVAKGKVKIRGCSYTDELLHGWDFNPSDAVEMEMYGDDEAAGRTIKFATKIVTNAVGHDKPRNSLILIEECEEQFFRAIRAKLSAMPEANQTFFNNREWVFEKKYNLETKSEDEPMPPPSKIKREV